MSAANDYPGEDPAQVTEHRIIPRDEFTDGGDEYPYEDDPGWDNTYSFAGDVRDDGVTYYCTICRCNPVDARAGFDTCDSCLRAQ